MLRRNLISIAALATAMGSTTLALADNIPQQEYNKYIDNHRTIQALDSSLFGEQINLRDGGVMFSVTDAELPGAGPTIRITRTFKLRENNHFVETTGTELGGGWMLEVPRLKTITNNTAGTSSTSVKGWQVPTGTSSGKDNRCSNLGPPGDLTFTDPVKYWAPYEWWSGYQLVDEGGNEQPLLGAVASYPQPPGIKAVTASNWRFECLSSLVNPPEAPQPGEGFKGYTPDGLIYYFNFLVYTTADNMTKPYGSTPMSAARTRQSVTPRKQRDAVTTLAPVNDVLTRRHAMLLATKVEDRFGNYLTYSYSPTGVLTGITATDGRAVTISGPTTVAGVTTTSITLNSGAAARTWTYVSNATTTTVTLPDTASVWTYNFAPLLVANLPATSTYKTGLCGINTTNTGSSVSGTATSPSGVTGPFNFTLRRFGRSYVPLECQDDDGDGDGYALYPADWFSFALTSRSFSGPGLATQTWNYSYSPAYASWSSSCSSGCTSEVWTDATAPDGTRQHTVFSNRFGESDSRLVREETYNASSVLQRTVNHEYAALLAPWPYAYPIEIGDDMQERTNKTRT